MNQGSTNVCVLAYRIAYKIIFEFWIPSLPLLSCELSVSMNENPYRKKTFFLQISSCLLPLGNAIFAIFAKDVPTIPKKHVWKDISWKYFLNIFLKKSFLKVPYINSTLNIRILDRTEKVNVNFCFHSSLWYLKKILSKFLCHLQHLFELSHRIAKIKSYVFFLDKTFRNTRAVKS